MTRLGMMKWSRSITETASSEAKNTQNAGNSQLAPRRTAAATNNAAVASSTSG